MKYKTTKIPGSERTYQKPMCDSCGQDPWPLFMVRDKLWDYSKDSLCVFCFQKKLGRKLLPDDLQPKHPVNAAIFLGIAMQKRVQNEHTTT